MFSTGWGAGFGVIAGLVRPDDHVVLDALSHACLQQGAAAATMNVSRVPHLNNRAMRRKLQEIRARDTKNAVLATRSICAEDRPHSASRLRAAPTSDALAALWLWRASRYSCCAA
ncbi:aminotransferase class I/II-fold pyridoxal phosphate-dependent enzyme [Corallococcus macrosporus]|uniref:aminotransferase class I/II-fold pyridoxal phosphate-dependent enzyme n=1 Tax=Corallococcus macrosporus TaxID=35 RepID=UPI002ED83A3C